MQLRRIIHRFYADFILPSRLSEFSTLLRCAQDNGYEIVSVSRFWDLTSQGTRTAIGKYLVLRHDVDTDLDTARAMWAIEKGHGAFGSYYFRLSTIDRTLMIDIDRSGGEASYHFEEIATVAKRLRLSSITEVHRHMGSIREEFSNNLRDLRRETGLSMHIVASHGDFVNRSLGMTNAAILDDAAFRRSIDVCLEVYDKQFAGLVSRRISDTLYPLFWQPEHPLEAIRAGAPVIYLLVHPRHWRANVLENLRDDMGRLWQGVCYRVRCA